MKPEVERLATRLMGWKCLASDTHTTYWIDFKGNDVALGSWNPYEKIADAMMLAEKIGGFFIKHYATNNPDYQSWECRSDDWGHRAMAKTASEAISRVALSWLEAKEGAEIQTDGREAA